MTIMKKCSNCFQHKLLSDFYPKRRRYRGRIIEGRQSRCKSCNAEVCKSYRKMKFQREFTTWVQGE